VIFRLPRIAETDRTLVGMHHGTPLPHGGWIEARRNLRQHLSLHLQSIPLDGCREKAVEFAVGTDGIIESVKSLHQQFKIIVVWSAPVDLNLAEACSSLVLT